MKLLQAFGQFAGQAAAEAVFGMTHIVTTNVTATNSATFDNVFTSTFDNYRILVDGVPTAGTPVLNYRLRSGGTSDSTANSYSTQYLYANNTVFTIARTTGDAGAFGNFGTEADVANFAVIDLLEPALVAETSHLARIAYPSGGMGWIRTTGVHNQVAAYDGIIIYLQSATNWTGSIRIYGRQKAAA